MQLSDYDIVEINDIKTSSKMVRCYDITVDDDNSFCVSIGGEEIITHNCDGRHITALLSLLFSRFWPELLKQGRVQMFQTPSVIVNYKGSVYNFIEESEYDEWIVGKTGYTTKYCKGLGGHDSKTFATFLQDPKSFVTLEYVPARDDEALSMAFDPKRADDRKDWVAVI